MSFSASNPPILVIDLIPGGSTMAGGRTWVYGSTHLVSDITATGFFAGCGEGSRNVSNANVGLRVGDLLINRSSTDSAAPGRTTMHSVIGSTANQASTSASSGWNTAYNITVSST